MQLLHNYGYFCFDRFTQQIGSLSYSILAIVGVKQRAPRQMPPRHGNCSTWQYILIVLYSIINHIAIVFFFTQFTCCTGDYSEEKTKEPIWKSNSSWKACFSWSRWKVTYVCSFSKPDQHFAVYATMQVTPKIIFLFFQCSLFMGIWLSANNTQPQIKAINKTNINHCP